MLDLALPLLAGLVATTVGGFLCGAAFHHVLVPLNEIFRSIGRPSYTNRRPALAIAHTCVYAHVPADCSCIPRNRRTVLEFRGTNALLRQAAVQGVYALGTELPVRVRYSTNEPVPLTRNTVVRSAIRGSALGAALGLIHIALLWAALHTWE
ncbi:hypothetical protein [Nocardia abscessus]|uniref:DUF3592 domain-containing protein n=1 Tax=Nocardia abscessus TaxID=120957 RepID=A0ABS0C8Y8_9NOCA|nr:hypothetical protein [Nocardia abscessus]MBF6225963.1 hypothetical protein [Nocardia abscessus]